MPLAASDPISSDFDSIDTDPPTAERNSAIIARIQLRPQRRSCPRTAVELQVVVVTGRGRREGRVTDLGIGGLFVQVDLIPSCGVRIEIEVTYHGSTMRLPAVVRWVDHVGFGAQFESLTPSQSQVVMTLIAEGRTQNR